jgi:hypothetical protein
MREVHQVHALVDELSPARPLWLSPPFPVISEPAAMAVTCSQVHQGPVIAGVHLAGQVPEGGVESVVEADLDPPPRALGSLSKCLHLAGAEASWLLHQDVTAGIQSPLSERRELVMGGRDDHDIRLQRQELIKIGAELPAVRGDKVLGPRRHGIGGAEEAVSRTESLSALAADEAAPRDRDRQSAPAGPVAVRDAHAYSLE